MSSTACPFCQQDNQCGVNEITESNPCWCQIKHVPQALIALLPAESINKQCICLACIDSYLKNPLSFKEDRCGQTE
tara:strand:- start:692 stop:919 length:228 start_codon:yes stop_codon:yes gene_type:complete